MPINQKLMTKLKSQYGNKKGESIYYAMEAKGKIVVRKKKHKK